MLPWLACLDCAVEGRVTSSSHVLPTASCCSQVHSQLAFGGHSLHGARNPADEEEGGEEPQQHSAMAATQVCALQCCR